MQWYISTFSTWINCKNDLCGAVNSKPVRSELFHLPRQDWAWMGGGDARAQTELERNRSGVGTMAINGSFPRRLV